MRRVLFRADSSSTIGTGHIMRDLVLAEREFGDAKVAFAVRDLPGNVNHKIEEAGYELIRLKSDATEELAEKAESFGAETIVIDHYGIGYEEEKRLKKLTNAVLYVLDDTYERHFCDILLNHNVYADFRRYEGLVPDRCELRCGKEYTLLRKAFYRMKKSRTLSRGPMRALVAMGGADTAQLNLPVLKALAPFSELQVDLVTTRANPALDALYAFVDGRKNVTLYVETEMAERMAEADFAVLTPSVTVNEAIFMELPFVAVETAQNQRYMSEYLRQSRRPLLERFEAPALQKEVAAMLESLLPSPVDFTRLDEKALRTVLAWRNDPTVRRWMLHKEPIGEAEHFAFVENLRNRTDRRYFLVSYESRPIGVVDLTGIDRQKQQAHIGLYAAPTEKGVGALLMRTLLRQARAMGIKRLIAEVFESNEKAIGLYRRFGFEQRGEKGSSGEKLWIMERTL